ncbi:hypothetical protein HZA33_03425 [Candidatus Pacearchaeota archaeon]|nr:hypothetical protein [Candidatus Pacearchaeota archaeon]
MRKNKKAWIRIAEAVSAILLLTSILLIISLRATEKEDISSNMYTIQRAILDEVSSNGNMRSVILSIDPEDPYKDDFKDENIQIKDFLKKRVPLGLSFNYTVCKPLESCFNPTVPRNKDVYVDDAIISTVPTEYSRKFIFYVWID